MSTRSFEQHLDPAFGPKRILALDGGGLRGVLTLGFLKKIEDTLREQTKGGGGFRLSDYYDLIGGTSTGSIIAAGLALGMSVDEIREHYFRLGNDIFKPSIFSRGFLNQKFDADKVAVALKSVFGDRTLGSPDFRTGLIVLCKRLDTGSQWVLSNNPRARFYSPKGETRTVPNKDYPLWSVVRASTAAPTYFAPEHIEVSQAGNGHAAVHGEFIDGGVSTMNNPALQMVLAATVPGYGFGWQMGEDRLEVTSVGTGRASQALGVTDGMGALAAPHAVKALKSVLDDCEDIVEVMMQWLSHSPTARSIDRDMGDLAGCCAGGAPSLRYHRYNVHFTPEWFKQAMDMEIPASALNELAAMDRPDNMNRLLEIGRLAADRFVRAEHFKHA